MKTNTTLFLRLTALFLSLLLLLQTAVCMAEGMPVQEEASPVLRVYLKRLALTDRADLYLTESYTARFATGTELLLPKKTELTVQLREGQLYLFTDGLAMSAGKSISLIRHGDGAALTGLRFSENGHEYPADLYLTIDGSVVQPVAHLTVENYLCGVVPYEMSDSFPLEALKAQAVCARTYAMAYLKKSGSWDVTDTTQHQVFMGVDASNRNAIRAVRETAGVVGFAGKELAVCYYGASNGGQTELVEHAWEGAKGPACYVMKDDPYDLENPESVVLRCRLNKNGKKLPDVLIAAMLEQLRKRMEGEGMLPAAECFRVDAVKSVALSGTTFKAPSRFMDTMTVTFTWSGRQVLGMPTQEIVPHTVGEGINGDEEVSLYVTPDPDATATPVPEVTPVPVFSEWLPQEETVLSFALFPELESALGLSINYTENEMITVTEEADAFVLESRRYGHGVGMSQRGAQWMAGHYGKTCYEILEFYYPGMELKKAPAGPAAVVTPVPALAETPSPAASPTPRPTLMPVTGEVPEGAWLASVEHIDEDSSLNLRKDPNAVGEILMRLYCHQPLLVLESCEDPEWVHVRTDVIEGYVMVKFLEKAE